MCIPKFPFFKCDRVESRLLNDAYRIPRYITIHRRSKTRSTRYFANEFGNNHMRSLSAKTVSDTALENPLARFSSLFSIFHPNKKHGKSSSFVSSKEHIGHLFRQAVAYISKEESKGQLLSVETLHL